MGCQHGAPMDKNKHIKHIVFRGFFRCMCQTWVTQCRLIVHICLNLTVPCSHKRSWSDYQGHAIGHFDMWTGGTGDKTANYVISGQLALISPLLAVVLDLSLKINTPLPHT